MVGNRSSVPEKMKSSIDPMAFWNVRVDDTMNGASGDVAGIRDDEPMCMHTTVSVSWQAAKKGSHWPVWIDGRPSGCGFSEKATAWLPPAGDRRTPAAASSGAHNGIIVRGMRRPFPSPPHHSSIIQSL